MNKQEFDVSISVIVKAKDRFEAVQKAREKIQSSEAQYFDVDNTTRNKCRKEEVFKRYYIESHTVSNMKGIVVSNADEDFPAHVVNDPEKFYCNVHELVNILSTEEITGCTDEPCRNPFGRKSKD